MLCVCTNRLTWEALYLIDFAFMEWSIEIYILIKVSVQLHSFFLCCCCAFRQLLHWRLPSMLLNHSSLIANHQTKQCDSWPPFAYVCIHNAWKKKTEWLFTPHRLIYSILLTWRIFFSHLQKALLTAINCISTKLSMKVQDIFTVAKLVALISIIFAGIYTMAMSKDCIF